MFFLIYKLTYRLLAIKTSATEFSKYTDVTKICQRLCLYNSCFFLDHFLRRWEERWRTQNLAGAYRCQSDSTQCFRVLVGLPNATPVPAFPFFEIRVLLLPTYQVSCPSEGHFFPCSNSTSHAGASEAEQKQWRHSTGGGRGDKISIVGGKGKRITGQVSKKAADLLLVKRELTISKIPLHFLKNILSLN